jgi:hypothetical protein
MSSSKKTIRTETTTEVETKDGITTTIVTTVETTTEPTPLAGFGSALPESIRPLRQANLASSASPIPPPSVKIRGGSTGSLGVLGASTGTPQPVSPAPTFDSSHEFRILSLETEDDFRKAFGHSSHHPIFNESAETIRYYEKCYAWKRQLFEVGEIISDGVMLPCDVSISFHMSGIGTMPWVEPAVRVIRHGGKTIWNDDHGKSCLLMSAALVSALTAYATHKGQHPDSAALINFSLA